MQQGEIKASATTLKVIHLAFMAATVIYVAVGYTLGKDAEQVPFPRLITMALIAAAVGTIVAGFAIPRIYWGRVAAGRVTDVEPGSLAAYQTGMIIGWACFEATAIYGLVLTIMTGQWLAVLVGAVVSLAFLASARPQPPR